MTVGVFPMIKRFFEGAASVVATPSGDARGHLRRRDFMTYDLTGTPESNAR